MKKSLVAALLLSVTSAFADLNPGLIGYYKLENLNDSSGNAAPLTNHGTVTFVAGKVGNCAHIVSASSQWLSRATGISNQFGTGDFSFAYWVKSVSHNSFMQTVDYGGRAASPSYYMEIQDGFITGVVTDS